MPPWMGGICFFRRRRVQATKRDGAAGTVARPALA
jgi:hypothetical protein